MLGACAMIEAGGQETQSAPQPPASPFPAQPTGFESLESGGLPDGIADEHMVA